MSIFTKIFSTGAKEVVGTVGTVLDNLITSKEEKEAAKLAIEQEINRHMEALQDKVLKEKELDVQDRASARTRETEFVKATGHLDYMQIFVGVICMAAFMMTLIFLIKVEIPQKNEHILINAVGILEGLVLSVATYYYGSSASSRLKDMRDKGAK